MKRYSVIIGIFAVMTLVLASTAAFARESISDRVNHQQGRIHRGVENGSLTHHEARILQDNLNHIRVSYDRAMANGHISHRERHRLNRMLDDNSEMISRSKRNMRMRRLY